MGCQNDAQDLRLDQMKLGHLFRKDLLSIAQTVGLRRQMIGRRWNYVRMGGGGGNLSWHSPGGRGSGYKEKSQQNLSVWPYVGLSVFC
jgi:hypothetical protein